VLIENVVPAVEWISVRKPTVNFDPLAPTSKSSFNRIRDRNSRVKLRRNSGEQREKRSRPASIDAVIDSLVSYVKGQLLRPLSGAGRWLVFGLTGGILVGGGVALGLLGILRLLQTEFSGISAENSRLSWLPYLIVLIIGVAVLVVTLQRINRTELFAERDQESGSR